MLQASGQPLVMLPRYSTLPDIQPTLGHYGWLQVDCRLWESHLEPFGRGSRSCSPLCAEVGVVKKGELPWGTRRVRLLSSSMSICCIPSAAVMTPSARIPEYWRFSRCYRGVPEVPERLFWRFSRCYGGLRELCLEVLWMLLGVWENCQEDL